MPIDCVLYLSTSTFFGRISPLEFMVHSIHLSSRTEVIGVSHPLHGCLRVQPIKGHVVVIFNKVISFVGGFCAKTVFVRGKFYLSTPFKAFNAMLAHNLKF